MTEGVGVKKLRNPAETRAVDASAISKESARRSRNGASIEIGAEVRELRKAKQMTLPQLAEACGYSTGFLSQVERGKSRLDVDALQKIAQALGVSVSWFFSDHDGDVSGERQFIVRRRNRRSLGLKDGIVDELLSPNLRGPLELIEARFPPGTSSGAESYTHRGDEAGVVLKGKLELFIGDQPYLLEEGDSFAFKSTTPHRYRNVSDGETVVIWVITPPSY